MTTGAEQVALLQERPAPAGPWALLFVDADLEDSAVETAPLAGPVLAGDADMTIAVLPPQKPAAAAGSSWTCSRTRDRTRDRVDADPAAVRHAVPDARGLRGGPAAGPRLGRGDRADDRPAPPGVPGAARCPATCTTGSPARTGARSCTGPGSTATCGSRWPAPPPPVTTGVGAPPVPWPAARLRGSPAPSRPRPPAAPRRPAPPRGTLAAISSGIATVAATAGIVVPESLSAKPISEQDAEAPRARGAAPASARRPPPAAARRAGPAARGRGPRTPPPPAAARSASEPNRISRFCSSLRCTTDHAPPSSSGLHERAEVGARVRGPQPVAHRQQHEHADRHRGDHQRPPPGDRRRPPPAARARRTPG